MLIAAELVAVTRMFKFEYPPDLLAQAGKFFYHEKTATKLILLRLPKFNAVFCSKCVSWGSIVIFIPFLLLFNLVPAKQFGKMEYIFGTTKTLLFCVMTVLNTIIHAWKRAGKGHFWTCNEPYSVAAPNITLADGHIVVTGGIGQLLGLWEAMTCSIFGLIGIETVAIIAASEFAFARLGTGIRLTLSQKIETFATLKQ